MRLGKPIVNRRRNPAERTRPCTARMPSAATPTHVSAAHQPGGPRPRFGLGALCCSLVTVFAAGCELGENLEGLVDKVKT